MLMINQPTSHKNSHKRRKPGMKMIPVKVTMKRIMTSRSMIIEERLFVGIAIHLAILNCSASN